jgi:hypothetical protein
MQLVDKRLVWAVCTALFFVAFRGGELLCRSETKFDPAFSLLVEDVKIIKGGGEGVKTLEFSIKSAKREQCGQGCSGGCVPVGARVVPSEGL